MAQQRSNGRPRIACEISAARVTAARANATQDAIELVQSRGLPPGAVTPALLSANVVDPAALRDAIGETLAAVGGRGRDIIAIIPDAAVRVVLVDFDTLPERRQDADSVVRFRLKKSLPFDVEKAAISYDATRNESQVKVVAAVAQISVIAEYEQAFRDAGYQPGLVLPSTLAALGAVDGSRPTLVLKVDSDTSSVAILDNNELVLFRTLENGGAANASGERLAEDVYPSLVFFQDNHGTNVDRVLVAGSISLQEIAPALESQTGSRVQELVAASALSGSGGPPRTELSGLVGALMG